jgi:hypothetical protein
LKEQRHAQCAPEKSLRSPQAEYFIKAQAEGPIEEGMRSWCMEGNTTISCFNTRHKRELVKIQRELSVRYHLEIKREI